MPGCERPNGHGKVLGGPRGERGFIHVSHMPRTRSSGMGLSRGYQQRIARSADRDNRSSSLVPRLTFEECAGIALPSILKIGISC